MVFWLSYKTRNGDYEKEIRAGSKEKAGIKAEKAKEKIIARHPTACGFELNDYRVILVRKAG